MSAPTTVITSESIEEGKTNILVGIDGSGEAEVDTGIGFFDHMLNSFAVHSGFGLTLTCKGDLEVDGHHSVEDCGIALGQALSLCLGDKAGIARFGQAFVPMDEALVMAAVDISGRGQLHYDVEMTCPLLGSFDVTLAQEFFIALATNMGATLNIRSVTGRNMHHILEAAFKAAARAISAAVAIDPRIADEVPSTKGVL